MQTETRVDAVETADFSFEMAQQIAAELNGHTAPRASPRLVYMAEDRGNGRARIAGVQNGELAFFL